MGNRYSNKRGQAVDLDAELEIVRRQHQDLGRKLWQVQKKKGGEITQNPITIAQRVLSLNGAHYRTWLANKAVEVIKFYKNPFWWLNPFNWGKKARDMARDRRLCIYAASRPHFYKSVTLKSEPFPFLHNSLFKAVFGLRNLFVRWGKVFQQRNESRQLNAEKNGTVVSGAQPVDPLVIAQRKEALAKIRQRAERKRLFQERLDQEQAQRDKEREQQRAEGAEHDRLFRAGLAKRSVERAKERAERERLFQEELAQKRAEAAGKREKETAERDEIRRREAQVERARHQRAMEQLRDLGQGIRDLGQEIRELNLRIALTQVVDRRKELEQQMRSSREICVRHGWTRREAEPDANRRERELVPTIARLKIMMAAVWVCQIAGASTLDKIAAVVAEHDRIASRNGLTRKGLNYTYSILNDQRIHAGPELDGSTQQSRNPHIIDESTCGTSIMRH